MRQQQLMRIRQSSCRGGLERGAAGAAPQLQRGAGVGAMAVCWVTAERVGSASSPHSSFLTAVQFHWPLTSPVTRCSWELFFTYCCTEGSNCKWKVRPPPGERPPGERPAATRSKAAARMLGASGWAAAETTPLSQTGRRSPCPAGPHRDQVSPGGVVEAGGFEQTKLLTTWTPCLLPP